jgi:hypothetical protein
MDNMQTFVVNNVSVQAPIGYRCINDYYSVLLSNLASIRFRKSRFDQSHLIPRYLANIALCEKAMQITATCHA